MQNQLQKHLMLHQEILLATGERFHVKHSFVAVSGVVVPPIGKDAPRVILFKL